MADKWNEVWSGIVEGRPVKVEEYEDGGELQAQTIQKDNAPGTLSQDDNSSVFPASVWKGASIVIDGPTKQDLGENLVSDGGFTAAGAAKIISSIP